MVPQGGKECEVFPRFTPEESGWFRTLSGMANNLNQLTQLALVEDLPPLALKCQALLRQIEELSTRINRHDR